MNNDTLTALYLVMYALYLLNGVLYTALNADRCPFLGEVGTNLYTFASVALWPVFAVAHMLADSGAKRMIVEWHSGFLSLARDLVGLLKSFLSFPKR